MKKAQYHHRDLKNAIIKAGITIIQCEGIELLNIRNVAKQSGVSHTALYRHYKNKEDLIAAIAVRGFHSMTKKIDEAIKKFSGDPMAQLLGIGKSYILFAAKNSIYYRLMFGDIIKNKTEYPDLYEIYDVGFRRLIEIIKKFPDNRKKKNEKIEITALSVWSLLHGYSCLIIDNKKDKNVGSDLQIDLIAEASLMLVR